MGIQQNFARILRRIIQERHLTQAEFADEFDIPPSTLKHYLSGRGNPSADALDELARKLHVPVAELLAEPLSGLEQAQAVLRAARELSCLTPEKQEKGVMLLQELIDLFQS